MCLASCVCAVMQRLRDHVTVQTIQDVFDFQTPPLEFVYDVGGAIVLVGNQANSVSDVISNIQRCRGKVHHHFL